VECSLNAVGRSVYRGEFSLSLSLSLGSSDGVSAAAALGGAGGAEGHGRAVRGQDTQEGRDRSERRHRVRARREASSRHVQQVAVPCRPPLLLPDQRTQPLLSSTPAWRHAEIKCFSIS